jgi:hypothetical protein
MEKGCSPMVIMLVVEKGCSLMQKGSSAMEKGSSLMEKGCSSVMEKGFHYYTMILYSYLGA